MPAFAMVYIRIPADQFSPNFVASNIGRDRLTPSQAQGLSTDEDDRAEHHRGVSGQTVIVID
jgi:hypothetical protein